MFYINRNVENTVKRSAKMFSTVLITGARQVGKTTLLKHMMGDIPYVTLDDPILLQSAIEEAGSFFKTAPRRLCMLTRLTGRCFMHRIPEHTLSVM